MNNNFKIDSCIKQINIENYQGIKKTFIKNIPEDIQWIFFTGKNGFGKTSILRGIFILLQDKKFAEGEMKGSFIEFKTPNKSLPSPHINGIGTKNESKFAKFSDFTNIVAYGAKRTDLRSDTQSPKIHANLFEEDSRLYNFESMYKDFKLFLKKNKFKIEKFERLLTAIIPNLSKIDISRKDSKVIYFEKDDNDYELPPVNFNQLAMGMRSIIAMISDMVYRFTDGTFEFEFNKNNQTDLEGIVLIDEFDAHLHPKWQKKLVEKLTNLFPKVQFIVSTHSPIPLLGAPKNTVILNVNRTKENGIIAQKLDIDFTTLTPDSIFTSKIFDLETILSNKALEKWNEFKKIRQQLKTEKDEDKKVELMNKYLEIGSDYSFGIYDKIKNNQK